MRITKSNRTHNKNKVLQWAAATSSEHARGLISCPAEQHDLSEHRQFTDLLQSQHGLWSDGYLLVLITNTDTC